MAEFGGGALTRTSDEIDSFSLRSWVTPASVLLHPERMERQTTESAKAAKMPAF
jgi:hypothetical protein